MREFPDGPQGTERLCRQLAHLGDDADRARKIIDDGTDLAFDERGLIHLLAGGHWHARDDAIGLLTALGTTFRDAATDIGLGTPRRSPGMGGLRPGSGGLRPGSGGLRPGSGGLRPGIGKPRPGISTPRPGTGTERMLAADASSMIDRSDVGGPQAYEPQRDLLAELAGPSASAREGARRLFHEDPFRAWARWAGGSWDAYRRVAAVWHHLGDWCQAVGQDLRRATADIPGKEPGRDYLITLAETAEAATTAFDRYADQYRRAAGTAQDLFEAVSRPLAEFVDSLLLAAVALAAGTLTVETVAGPISGPGAAVLLTGGAIDRYEEIARLHGRARDTFAGINEVVESISTPAVRAYS